MKILAITSKSPYPLHEGRALRTYNLLRQAARRHEIHLVSYLQTPEDDSGIGHMRDLCSVVHGVPLYRCKSRIDAVRDVLLELGRAEPLPIIKYETRAMRIALAALFSKHRYDLVHLDILHVAALFNAVSSIPTLLNEHNVEAQILARRAEQEPRSWARAYLLRQQRKMQWFETLTCRRATSVIAVSEADADTLSKWTGRSDLSVVPNGVDTEFFTPNSRMGRPNELVYVGGLTWFPNQDAVSSFVEQTLPLIAAEVPDVRLTVIGKNPNNSAVRALGQHPRVRLLGMVDDIRPYVAEAAVYVVPLRIGGGTRLKILDALAMGKAVVATPIGCEGLSVTSGLNLQIAVDSAEFAQQVVSLLRDSGRAQALGEAGRQLVERYYGWAAIGDVLESTYQRTVRARRVE